MARCLVKRSPVFAAVSLLSPKFFVPVCPKIKFTNRLSFDPYYCSPRHPGDIGLATASSHWPVLELSSHLKMTLIVAYYPLHGKQKYQ